MKNKKLVYKLFNCFFIIVCFSILFLFTSNTSVFADGVGVEINDKNFPDDGFKILVKRYDIDNNGYLSADELSVVTEIFTDGLSSAEGIKYFVNLERFQCNNNRLTELDVSHNEKLKELRCWSNKITSLKIPKSLEILYCNNNKITELDICDFPYLKEVQCYSNRMTNLVIKNNPCLTSIECGECNISKIVIKNNPKLVDFQCGGNKLKSLDTSDIVNLVTLGCTGNGLIKLNIQNNKKLESLVCDNNNLIELDVHNNIKIKAIDCGNNKIKKMDLSHNPELELLYCFDNEIEKIALKNSKLKKLWCSRNRLKTIDTSSCKSLEMFYCGENKELKFIDVRKNLNLNDFYHDANLPVYIPKSGFNYSRVNYYFDDSASNSVYMIKRKGSLRVQGEVVYLHPVNKNVKSINIPETVSANGIKYKVIAINQEAFVGCTGLTKVTISKTIREIGDKAFCNCKTIKCIIFKGSNIRKIGKNSFKGTTVNTKFKVPKKKYDKYRKMILKAGANRNATITKLHYS